MSAFVRVCLIACLAVAAVANAQDAKKDPPKSSPEALRDYSNAVKAHNAKAYALAADEWSGFLAKYPEDPLAPKAHYYLGVCHLQNKDLEDAAEEFGGLVKDPKFDLIDDARFNLGWVQYTLAQSGKDELYPTAAATLAELVKANPQSDKAAEALYFQGECFYAMKKLVEAAGLYGRIVADYPKSSLVCDSLYAQGVSLEEAKKYPEAGKAYDAFITTCADSDLLTEVKMRKAETVLQAGDYETAADMFAKAAATEGFSLADHAAYRGAFCYAKQDKFAEAGKAYADLCETFPGSSYVPESEMGAARAFYKAKDPAAKIWLDRVIAKGGKDLAEAAHWRCRLHLAENQAAEAEKLSSETIPKAADSQYISHLKLDQADAVYMDSARRSDAVKLYQALVAAHSDSPVAPQATYYAAFGLLELKQHEQAKKQAGEFLAKYADNDLEPDARYVQAESMLQLQQYPESEQAFSDLSEKYKSHPDRELWLVRRGVAMYLQKKYKETAEAMKAALAEVKSNDGKAEVQYLIGGSEFYTGQFESGAKALEASLQAAPKWRQADETLLLLSRCQHKLKQYQAAAATVSKMLADFPQSKVLDQAYYRLAEYQYADEKFAEAIDNYDKCLSANAQSPFVPYALYGKGWTLLNTDKFDAAVAPLTKLVDQYKDHVLTEDARFARAMAQRKAGKHKEALADLMVYLKQESLPDEQFCHALYEKGLAEVSLNQFDESVKTFSEILKKNPDYQDADNVLYEWAWSLKSMKKESEAVTRFAELSNKFGDSPLAAEAHYHVAENLYAEEKFAEAEKQYVLARDKSDKSSDIHEKALFKLGWSLFQQKKYKEAAGQFSAQRTAAPNGGLVGDAMFMQGESLFRAGDHENALPVFLKSMDAKLSSPAMEVLSQLHAGQCATQLKKWDEGLKLLQEIPTKFPQTPHLAEALYERGWAHQNLGNKEEALKDYQAAAEKGRGIVVARSRFMTGELLFEKKEFDEAIKEFQRVMFFFGDNAEADIKNWQAKSGYEAGRCAEVQIQDEKDAARKAKHIADAKKFYGYVAEKHPEHELAAQAKKRLEVLAKL